MDARSNRPGQRPPTRPGRRQRRVTTAPDGQSLPTELSQERSGSPAGSTGTGAAGLSATKRFRRPDFRSVFRSALRSVFHKPTRAELFPAGTWRSLWLGFQTWAISWAVLVLLAIAVWTPTAATPSEKGTKWSDALMVGNAIFAAAFRAEFSSETMRFSLTPWGLTLLIGLMLAASLRAAKPANAPALAWGLLAFLLPTWVCLGFAAVSLVVWRAFIFSLFFAAIVFFVVARHLTWWNVTAFFPEGEPWPWLSLAGRCLRVLAGGGAALSAVFLLAGLITGWEQMRTIWTGLKPDALGSVAMFLAILAYLPTLLVWGIAWITGPGLSLGQGTVFSPGQVIGGDLPPVPVLACLPDAPVGWWPLIFPVALAIGLGLYLGGRHQLGLADTALSLALFLAGLLVGGLLIVWFVSGSLGPGRLVNVGPTGSTLYAGVLAWGVPFVVTALLNHPQMRAATRRFAVRISGKNPEALPTARIDL